jgi:hypothetical protein
MSRASLLMACGFALLARPVLAIEFECVGEEKGINSLTGKETVSPVTLRVVIDGKKATLQELGETGFTAPIDFTARESRKAWTLKASLGRSGEFRFQIDKQTGQFNSESWLLSRANVSTQQGKCEEVANSGKDL